MRIRDEEMMAAAATAASEHVAAIGVATDGDGWMTLRFTITDAAGVFAVRLPLPSSDALKPWLTQPPRDAEDAAAMLTLFLEEEAATGCVHWATTTTSGDERVFELTPYGFRHSSTTEHRRLLRAAGTGGWWGRVQESDLAPPADPRLADLREAPLTYDEVGATRGDLPARYRTFEVGRHIGVGRPWFETASAWLLTWEMHRRAGLRVSTVGPVALGRKALLEFRFGPWWIPAPVRVVDLVQGDVEVGFSYGTLPGHPEQGEERFAVRLEPDGAVHAHVRAFARPGRWFTRLGGPLARQLQGAVTQRYLDALTDHPGRSGGSRRR